MNAAIIFEPDAYVLDGPRLMGRQSAGHGFLRAAVKAHAGAPIFGVTPSRASAEAFAGLAKRFDPAAQPQWIPPQRLDRLAEQGVLYRPDLAIHIPARLRLRAGPAAFSICGVTHTLSTYGAADSAAQLVTAPLMPWDAVVCTSRAAQQFLQTTMEAEQAYLAWRFGRPVAAPAVQRPIIPLGVHPDDFAFTRSDRNKARNSLGLAIDEVAALFAGRLTFNGKAHPFQMFRAAEAAARAASRRLVLILAGQFPTAAIEDAFRTAAAGICPGVRVLFVDGKDATTYRSAWQAADIFVSLSDSIQETFGLTPLEAMAAGLPVLVSDWDGYRDTVRDGVDGFRVPSWAPPAGAGEPSARDHEANGDYEIYLSRTSTTISVDPAIAAERLRQLVDDADLRRRLGEAGREHVRRSFDWAVIYRQYQELWRELEAIRARAAADPALRVAAAPRAAPAWLDPFASFAHYPTRQIGLQTRLSLAPGATAAVYEALGGYAMLSFWKSPTEVIERVFAAIGQGQPSVQEAAARAGVPIDRLLELVGRLAKLELVRLHAPEDAG